MNRMAVPDELDERELGLVLAGRRRAFSGELVVGGHLVPEQREAVNREATYIDLAHGAAAAPGAVEEQVRARARLASFSRRQRRAFEARATGLVEDLTTSVPVEPDDEAGSGRPSQTPRWGSRAASP